MSTIPPMDTPDPITGFSRREIAEVVASWDYVKLNLSDNGLDIFINFFSTFPEHQKLFPAFAAEPLDRLRKSDRLRTHTDSVTFAISSVVERLSTPANLRPILLHLGVKHNRHKVPEQAFKDFKNVFLHWLRRKLGTRLTLSSMMVWEKAMTLMITCINQGIASPELFKGKEVTFDPNYN